MKKVWMPEKEEVPAIEVVDAKQLTKASKILTSAQRLFAEQTEMYKELAREKN